MSSNLFQYLHRVKLSTDLKISNFDIRFSKASVEKRMRRKSGLRHVKLEDEVFEVRGEQSCSRINSAMACAAHCHDTARQNVTKAVCSHDIRVCIATLLSTFDSPIIYELLFSFYVKIFFGQIYLKN